MFIYLLNIQAENKGEVPITDMTRKDKVDIYFQIQCFFSEMALREIVSMVAEDITGTKTLIVPFTDDEDEIT